MTTNLPFTTQDVLDAYAHHPEIKPICNIYSLEDLKGRKTHCCPLEILAFDKGKSFYCNENLGITQLQGGSFMAGFDGDKFDQFTEIDKEAYNLGLSLREILQPIPAEILTSFLGVE